MKLVALVALLGALALTGCGSAASPSPTKDTPAGLVSAPPTGTVQGLFHVVGGPAPGVDNPLPGRLTIVGPDGSVTHADIGADGRYAISLTPGDYRISASSKGYDRCTTRDPVTTITAGRTVTADITCDVP